MAAVSWILLSLYILENALFTDMQAIKVCNQLVLDASIVSIPLHEYIGSSQDVVCSLDGTARCHLLSPLLCFQIEPHRVQTPFAAGNCEN